jgi:hypothetical protein
VRSSWTGEKRSMPGVPRLRGGARVMGTPEVGAGLRAAGAHSRTQGTGGQEEVDVAAGVAEEGVC